MRDAGANPVAGDFLEPVAGRSPGIHSNQGIHPVTPGAVSAVAATQDAAEKAHMAEFQPVVTDVTMAPETAALAPLATQQLAATAKLIDGVTDVDVTADAATVWASDDVAVATVDAVGLVTAVAAGVAGVTATYKGSLDTCAVTVA